MVWMIDSLFDYPETRLKLYNNRLYIFSKKVEWIKPESS